MSIVYDGTTVMGMNIPLKSPNEILLNYGEIMLCRKIINHHPQCKKCLEALYNRLFKYDIEVKMGNKRVTLSKATKSHISKYYVKFCKEFIACYYEMGIVPVSIAQLKDGTRYPVVMKEMGYVTIFVDSKDRKGKGYRFYKLYSKTTGQRLNQIKYDKSTIIFDGYGHDPDFNGHINSPISTCIPIITFNEKIFHCAFVTAEENCRPMLITEVNDPEQYRNAHSLESNVAFELWFGDRDRQNENALLDRVRVNRVEAKMMEEYNAMYNQMWNKIFAGSGMRTTGSSTSRPPPMPVRNIPVGQTVASNVPRAMSRNDILEINEREEEIISAIFNVPKSLFAGEQRTVGGVKASSEIFTQNLMSWSLRLTEPLTMAMKCIHMDEVCDIYEKEFFKANKIDREKFLAKLNGKKTKPQQSSENKRKRTDTIDEYDTIDDFTITEEDSSYLKKTAPKRRQQSNSESDNEQQEHEEVEDEVNKYEVEIYQKLESMISMDQLSVRYPVLPYENADEVWQHYTRGIISYGDCVIYSKMISGLPITDEDVNAKEPWQEYMKAMLVQQQMDAEAEMLFNERFMKPATKSMQKELGSKESKGKDKEKKKEKKQKKEEKAKSSDNKKED